MVYTKKQGGEKMTVKLYSTLELSKVLKVSKQAVNKAEREGRIEQPAFRIGKYKGWTEEQMKRIKKG